MKSSSLVVVGASLLIVATGCAMEGRVAAQPAYPQQPPIGYDSPGQGHQPQQAPPQPGPQPGPQLGEVQQQPAQPAQAGEIEIGAEQPQAAEAQQQAQAPQQADDYQDTDPAAVTDFRAALDPHGQWVDDASYGNVWVPNQAEVGSDFAPYVSAGHWTYDNEYTWVSDYSWGWAPFHYGRWAYMGGRGWGWIPGRRYAGAWVNWRTGHDGYGYVGWAPLAPSWYWRGGRAYGLGFYPTHAYAFCHTGALFSPGLHGHIVTGPHVGVVAGNTRTFVPAHPGVGRSVGRPVGPTPGSLHIGAHAVVAPPANHAGLVHAQNYGRPASAVAMGGHAPTTHASGGMAHNAPGHAMPGHGMPSHQAPAYRGPQGRPSYGGQYHGPYGRPQGQYRSPQGSYHAPQYRSPQGSYHAPQNRSPQGSYHAPQYHPPPQYHAPSGGSSHSSGHGSSGSHSSGGSRGGSSGGSHGGGGGRHR